MLVEFSMQFAGDPIKKFIGQQTNCWQLPSVWEGALWASWALKFLKIPDSVSWASVLSLGRDVLTKRKTAI